ncbi:MAG TPA: amidohydrolase family protein [Propionibacteriaceae bacterium]|nr:amidohydrolase family protein [Propionibacteriaceae bacterium]
MTTSQLLCDHLVTPNATLEPGLVTVSDGLITAVGRPGAEDAAGAVRISDWTVPGFVDSHVHGGGGASYPTTDAAEALRARDFHRHCGTTTSFASLVTADLGTLCAQIATLVPLVVAGHFAGIHLEGPFLSPARHGAHDPALLRHPDAAALDRLLAAGEGQITMITLAPELPGALAAIERIVAAGAVAAIGHTDGDHTAAAEALDAGATVVTHLFNAMPGVHHREPGPIPLLLSDRRAMVELICDGFHLHPDVVALAIAAAGPERVALVTDAMAAAGAPDGHYSLGDHRSVSVVGGQARLVTADGRPGTIAGSTLTMAAAFAAVVAAGVPIPATASMAATTPARRHRLAGAGVLEAGARADLCVVDDQGSLLRVMQSGRWIR